MRNPEKSLPNQIQSWGDLKSAYRLFNEKDVTYKKLQKPYIENVKKEAKNSDSNIVLFIQDTTTMDYKNKFIKVKRVENQNFTQNGRSQWVTKLMKR